MNVSLLTYTPDPLRVMFTAARTCYSADTPHEIWEQTAFQVRGTVSAQIEAEEDQRKRMLRTVRGCIVRNHNTVLRHANFTWAISGISRACANQLTRHSAGIAFDQQSLRYVSLGDDGQRVDWVIPEAVTGVNAGLMRGHAEAALRLYRSMLDDGIAEEDARAVLPLCTPTNLTCTANLAALLHLYRVRYQGTTGKPQDEIRCLAGEMVRTVVKAEPWLASLCRWMGRP